MPLAGHYCLMDYSQQSVSKIQATLMPNSLEPIRHTAEGSMAQIASGQLWCLGQIFYTERLYKYSNLYGPMWTCCQFS